jgi:hypothetical protein
VLVGFQDQTITDDQNNGQAQFDPSVGGLSRGAAAGLAIGLITAAALIGGASIYYKMRLQKKRFRAKVASLN